MALSMTCGVIMFYYAQYTRQVTDFAGIKGPSKVAARQSLPAGRAVNELCDAVARLAPAAASMHNVCLTAADDLQRINEKSATMIDRDDDKPILQPDRTKLYDNLLIRSIRNYHIILARLQKTVQASTLPRVMRPGCTVCEGVFVKGGYPFMFISPFDLKLQ